mmetsp:Transcript_23384/g.20326  ORF Transcript_23384/g.20326 Transcript_23384/m.20326 type:complete len:136 (+) Transcript_23384:111-518(+)
MSKALFIPQNFEGDLSDGMSSTSESILEHGSPISFENQEQYGHVRASKKIRKKRNAYHKIDDRIRVKLLEAVQKGETLKSAARKYGINYSSAKSVLHTYRKEGRILKKATQERTLFGGECPHENCYQNDCYHHQQ